uniref:Uncharacterized protein n=1 Tax=Amphimedon queenslandica TaxID=400682 RepID=A0A1X7TKZ0_AMPQE
MSQVWKMGHNQRVCRSSVNDKAESPMDTMFLGAITQKKSDPLTVKIPMNEYSFVFKVNTVADVRVIPNELYRRDWYGPLKQAGMSLVVLSQNTLAVIGRFEAHIGMHKKVVERVHVVKVL